MEKPRIVHVITDYPDGIGQGNSYAIGNLLEQTDNQAEHLVISLNRVREPVFRITQRLPNVIVCEVFSLPGGVLSNSFLWLVALALQPYLKATFKADLIHGHKLTTDGVLAYFLSKQTGIPFALTICGETDVRFVRYKPFSKRLFRKVIQQALHTFWISAWAKPVITRQLGISPDSQSKVPIVCRVPGLSMFPAPLPEKPAQRFVFLARLARARKKGLFHILDVLADRPEYQLDIYGPLTPDELTALEASIARREIGPQVRYCGVLSPEQFTEVLPQYLGLLMPSQDETFGMVYVEALMCGLPVLCCVGSGIDGHINKPYIRLSTYADVKALGHEMDILFRHGDTLKQQLHQDWKTGELACFSPEHIGKHYTGWLESVLN